MHFSINSKNFIFYEEKFYGIKIKLFYKFQPFKIKLFYKFQPYRTTPLVLPHAKTIHDHGEVGNKFISTVREDNQPRVIEYSWHKIFQIMLYFKPYRTSTLIMPTPRTIHEVLVLLWILFRIRKRSSNYDIY